MQYNTARKPMPIKEYGRSVQNMVDNLLTIQDKEKRQQNADAIIEIMTILNPTIKNVDDYKHKLWDHLHIMSNFQLNVECPFEPPTKEIIEEKPAPLSYPKTKIKWNHLGKTFEKLYDKAVAETDPEKKVGFVQTLGMFMKVAYNNWHKENVHDDNIKEELGVISKGEMIYNTALKYTDAVDMGSGEVIRGAKQSLTMTSNNFKNRNNRNNNNRNNNNNNRNNNNKFKKKSNY